METILSLAEKTEVFADIGCDHGYISRELLERDLAEKVIATDISKNSLKKAECLPITLSARQTIEFRTGNGLSVLNENEADGVIIAGIGGLEIINIISKEPEKAKGLKQLILCPHKNAPELRKFLYSCGFNINKEKLAFENTRYYECIKAEFIDKACEITDFEAEIGKGFINDKAMLLKSFLEYKIKTLNTIFNRIDDNKKYPELEQKRKLKDKMEEVLKCL